VAPDRDAPELPETPWWRRRWFTVAWSAAWLAAVSGYVVGGAGVAPLPALLTVLVLAAALWAGSLGGRRRRKLGEDAEDA
jgi:hypothetical protein